MNRESDRAELLKWLRTAILQGREECKYLKLKLAFQRSDAGAIESWQVERDTDLDLLADSIIDTLVQHANGLGELQRYELLSFAGTGAAHMKTHTMNHRGPSLSDDGSGSDSGMDMPGSMTEGPTTRGHMHMMMRMTNDMHKSSIGGYGNMVLMLTRQLEQREARIQQLERTNTETFRLQQELLDRHEEREIERAKRRRRTEIEDMVVKQVFMVAPTIVNKLLGQNLLPESKNGDTELIKALLDSLSEEQMAQIQHIFKPEQFQAVADLYLKYKDEHEAEQNRLRGSAITTTTTTATSNGSVRTVTPP